MYPASQRARAVLSSAHPVPALAPRRVPSPPRQQHAALPPGGWPEYLPWRPVPPFAPGMVPLLSKRLSQPLTVLCALQALQQAVAPPEVQPAQPQPQGQARACEEEAERRRAGLDLDLARVESLCVHVLGAGGFEVPADPVWEELMHL